MKISKKLIINEAYEVKRFFDKHKKLPKYATISNSQFTPPQYSYVFAKLVSKMSLPTVNKMSVASPKEDKGDVVDFTLKQNEYISIAQRVVDFMERNKRCPNYVEYKKKHISWSLYTYCFIKILSFYKENGRLPSTCTLLNNGSGVGGESVSLTGDDGSSYTATTNSNGVATFQLIGYGNITYTANCKDLSDTCTVNGMNNRIATNITCSVHEGNGNPIPITVTWTLKDSSGNALSGMSVTGGYKYQSSSSSTTDRTQTGTTNSSGQWTYSTTRAKKQTYPKLQCNGGSFSGTWKYAPC